MKKLLSAMLIACITAGQVLSSTASVLAEENAAEDTAAAEITETAVNEVTADINDIEIQTEESAAVNAVFDEPEETEEIIPSVSSGTWKRDSIGWWYQTADRGYLKNGVFTINNTVYRFDSNGYMTTGWAYTDGSWMYFGTDGARVNYGWKKVSDSWYFFEAGRMLQSTWIDGYYVKSNGAMATGWVQLGNDWYKFNSSGILIMGWHKVGDKWYYLDPENEGQMLAGTTLYDGGKQYYLKSNGAMAVGWVQRDGDWFYYTSDGSMKTGWQKSGGSWYYMRPQAEGEHEKGSMLHNGWTKLGTITYFFNDNGSMFTGWKKKDGNWYYFQSSGALASGWKSIDGLWYYFGSDNVMVTGTQVIDGKTYNFNSSGAWMDDPMSIAKKYVGMTGTCTYIAWLATYEFTGMHGMANSIEGATREVPASQARPGDIVYYGNGAHVAVYLGNGKCLSGNTGLGGCHPCAVIWNVSDSSHYYSGVRYLRVTKDVPGTWNSSKTNFYWA